VHPEAQLLRCFIFAISFKQLLDSCIENVNNISHSDNVKRGNISNVFCWA